MPKRIRRAEIVRKCELREARRFRQSQRDEAVQAMWERLG